MAIYLKPRRGTQSKASDLVLQKGEIFFEIPTSGEGKGLGKIKMGDGVTPYSDLPYFLTFTNASSADYATNAGTAAYASAIPSHNHTTAEITNFDSAVTSLMSNTGTAAVANNIPVNPTDTSNMNIWITG